MPCAMLSGGTIQHMDTELSSCRSAVGIQTGEFIEGSFFLHVC
jgi:hypothetical protein